jgi:hypothetical protein
MKSSMFERMTVRKLVSDEEIYLVFAIGDTGPQLGKEDMISFFHCSHDLLRTHAGICR